VQRVQAQASPALPSNEEPEAWPEKLRAIIGSSMLFSPASIAD
jgi:hypothetical protein